MDGAWGYLWEMLGEGRQGLGANGVAYGRAGTGFRIRGVHAETGADGQQNANTQYQGQPRTNDFFTFPAITSMWIAKFADPSTTSTSTWPHRGKRSRSCSGELLRFLMVLGIRQYPVQRMSIPVGTDLHIGQGKNLACNGFKGWLPFPWSRCRNLTWITG